MHRFCTFEIITIYYRKGDSLDMSSYNSKEKYPYLQHIFGVCLYYDCKAFNLPVETLASNEKDFWADGPKIHHFKFIKLERPWDILTWQRDNKQSILQQKGSNLTGAALQAFWQHCEGETFFSSKTWWFIRFI